VRGRNVVGVAGVVGVLHEEEVVILPLSSRGRRVA